MALVCTICKRATQIAKYYPSTGWYFCVSKRSEKFLDVHQHCNSDSESLFGPTHFVIGYEEPESPEKWEWEPLTKQEKEEIILKLTASQNGE